MRRFQTFTRSKSPESLSPVDVKEFLTFLAVKKKVSASTQNQAFNALLFLFRHVLNKEIEGLSTVVRAHKKRRLPVVLTTMIYTHVAQKNKLGVTSPLD